jgi:Protein-tyrosine phosphatase.
MYWPKEGTETYGVIQVKLMKEDVMATYTVRTLQIRHLRVSQTSYNEVIKFLFKSLKLF